LIIPAFNEEARIGSTLNRILRFLRSQPYTSEIIVVDDGSKDRTVEVVREISQGDDIVQMLRRQHLGKGGAIRAGMLEGRGKYLFFSDADLSVPIETLPAFLTELENDCDVTIGTRQKAGARIEVHQPFYREFMGKTYTRLSNWILSLRVSDFTCGFKGFRRAAAQDLFSRQRLRNWSFDAEILYLARLKGYQVQEVPVAWRDDRGSKVRLWRDVVTSFLGVIQIRLYDFQGRYR
jgi:dolichyl-phosphate beta-glucosyltransferase